MRRAFATAIFVSLCIAGAPAAVHSQSLAEVAAKTRRQRQAEGTKPPKVITDDELARGRRGAPPDEVAPAEDSSSSDSASSGSASKDQGAQGQTKEKTDDEIRAEAKADWEKRQKAAEEKVTQLTQEIEAINRDLSDARYGQFGTGRADRIQRRDAATAELDAAKEELDSLEEERRRQGF